MTRWNEHASGQDAEQLMRYAAYREELTYHQWCDKYGIVDASMARNIQRREMQPPRGNLDGMAHGTPAQKTYRGDPPHYETADWGPDPRELTADNVLENERRAGRWRRDPQK